MFDKGVWVEELEFPNFQLRRPAGSLFFRKPHPPGLSLNFLGWKICDVLCDVTLASMAAQVLTIRCYSKQHDSPEIVSGDLRF